MNLLNGEFLFIIIFAIVCAGGIFIYRQVGDQHLRNKALDINTVNDDQSQIIVLEPYTGIHPWLEVGERLACEVFLDNKLTGKINYLAKYRGVRRQPVLKFNTPNKLHQLRLSGQLITAKGKSHSFNRIWNVGDVAAYTLPLYEQQLTLPQRIKKFAEKMALEEEKSEGEFLNPLELKKTEPDYVEALNAAEARLKMHLPQALRELSCYQISIQDSFFVVPSKLKTVIEEVRLWSGSAQEANRREKLLSPNTLARYNRSVMVFVENGDGIGALAWDPQGITEGEPSNIWIDQPGFGAKPVSENTGVWFWMHEEFIDAPQLLLTSDGYPYSDEEALLSIFKRFVMEPIMDYIQLEDVKESFLIIDSKHPRGFLQLYFDINKKPNFMFRSYENAEYSQL